MITKDEVLKTVAKLEDTVAEYPWEGDFYSTVLRHGKNKKWFGVLLKASVNYFERYGVLPPEGFEVLNLKCPPDLQVFLRSKYPSGILPAYHMNKTHWISLVLRADVDRKDIDELIKLSYEITKK